MNCPHCETRINRHEAIRCLDAWIAEYVMGWKPYKIVNYNILYPPTMQANADAHAYGYKPFDPDCEYDFDSSHFFDSSRGGKTKPIVPKYSTEIQVAWGIVEKIAKTNYVDIGVDEHGAQVQIDSFEDDRWEFGAVESTRAETAPLAICRAALKASEK